MKVQRDKKEEDGFSYIDVMCALVILTVGILAMTAAIVSSLTRSYETEQNLVSKQMVQSTIESIFAARDIRLTNGLSGWDKVGNVGSNPSPPPSGPPAGIFVTGWNPVRELPGSDGVIGTADDACSGTGNCEAGLTNPVVQGYQRQIQIVDVDDPDRPAAQYGFQRRRITVTVRYFVNQAQRQQAATTIIANF